MARPDKAAAVAELTEEFRSSNAVVLTEYRGLTVKQLTDLRRTLGGSASYAIVKNTLTKIAAKEAGVESLDADLAGPSAIAFVTGDPVDAARGLRDFARTHPALVIKGGVLDGKPLTADEIRRLADLESREVLLAKLAGAMKASLSGAVALFAAPLAQTARLVEALRQKAEADPSILAGGSGADAVSTEPDATPADADATPVDADATPADSDATPLDAVASPADADAAPADADVTPVEDTSTTESDAAPDEA